VEKHKDMQFDRSAVGEVVLVQFGGRSTVKEIFCIFLQFMFQFITGNFCQILITFPRKIALMTWFLDETILRKFTSFFFNIFFEDEFQVSRSKLSIRMPEKCGIGNTRVISVNMLPIRKLAGALAKSGEPVRVRCEIA